MTKLNDSDGHSRKDTSVLEEASKNVCRQLYELDRRVVRLQRLGDPKGADPSLKQEEKEILPMLLERR